MGYPPPPQPPAHAGTGHTAVASAQVSADSSIGGLVQISLRRAFRLQIQPDEVLASERTALASANPPIVDPNLQAFLAWRRSLLVLIAVALVPLTGLRLLEAMQGELPTMLRAVQLVPAIAEGVFCAICWAQLKHWSHWRRQRRALFIGWMVFMLAPFVVYLYPLQQALAEMTTAAAAAEGADLAAAPEAANVLTMVASMVLAISALLTLAPKAISIMPGIIRAAIVSKLLFPGLAGPGWIIVMAAPIYAVFAYVILIVPYQITGSGMFVGAMVGVIAAQFVLGRAGYQLAKPCTDEQAIAEVKKARATYLLAMVVALPSSSRTSPPRARPRRRHARPSRTPGRRATRLPGRRRRPARTRRTRPGTPPPAACPWPLRRAGSPRNPHP